MRLKNSPLRKNALQVVLLLVVALVAVSCQGLSGLTSQDNGSTLSSQTNPVEIGRVVSSSGLDADSCPVDTVSTFDRSDSIYIVAENSTVPSGTDIFARLSHEGQPIEDSVLITADQDYEGTCIFFEFEATSGAEVLDTGDYEAQMIINGNPGPSVDFQVR